MNGKQDDSIRNVEMMRGIAAMVVAYFHCRVIAWVGIRHYAEMSHVVFSLDTLLAYVTIPFVWGSIGVPIFFVISGYCIHRGHAAKLARDPRYRLDAADFLLRRFVRIYPVLLFALLLTLALDSISLQFVPHNERLGDLGLTAFVGNLLALQGIAVPTFGSNGALWTLALEIQFYALYPLLFAAQRRLGSSRTLVALALLNAASYGLFERHGITVFTSYWLSWYLGAWVAQWQLAGGRAPVGRLGVLAALLLVAGCAVSFESQYSGFQLWALAFALFLPIVLQARTGRSLAMRCLEKVGEFSYSLYVVHIPVFVLLVSWLFHSVKPDSIFYSMGFFLIALGVAYVFHLLVERPVLRMLRKMSSRRAGRVTKLASADLLPLDGRR
ncbi:peptidoglycan/LPS O-acetylase OafA/YrhL [Paraburkholderia sp. GAS41]|jgi:peptidoglycan/LPS O-acetylase OafA/YrhL|uniref:acyltransferase family protein n=1 Tax=Paraburkholderia sp. GAS41 TaxID=3035134 RepID=UPI003D20C52C